MSYRGKSDFDEPTVEDVEKSRRAMMWILPAILFQQGSNMLGHQDAGLPRQLFYAVTWAVLTISVLLFLSGWKFRWMGQRNHELLNDEWHRATSSDAMRWGMIGAVAVGIVLTFVALWVTLEARMTINLIVGAALSVAAVRYAWLNRDLPGTDDE